MYVYHIDTHNMSTDATRELLCCPLFTLLNQQKL